MPERGFDTATWDADDWFQDLSKDQRYLFIYLWTNNHCNQAGLYHITLSTISFATKIPKEELPDLLRSLSPKVEWYSDENLIWVRNFIKRQSKSSKFLAAAAKSLVPIKNTIKDNGVIKELLRYNLQRHSISIPYQYYIDKVSILTRVTVPDPVPDTDPVSDKGTGVVKGGNETIPRSESENGESLCEGDREVISTWFSVRGFRMAPSDASELVARLRTEFPDVDILAESKKWAARKLSEPLTKNTRPSAQIWNFMYNARKFAQERRERENRGKRLAGARPASDFRSGKW